MERSSCSESAFYGGGLIVVIVNGEIARQAQMMRFATDQAGAEGMKRGDPDVRGVAAGGAQQVADAVFHDAGGFIGEGYGENGAARDAPLYQVSDAIGDDTRLAGAGAGQNQQRAFGREHRFALALVEFVEECCG